MAVQQRVMSLYGKHASVCKSRLCVNISELLLFSQNRLSLKDQVRQQIVPLKFTFPHLADTFMQS